MHEEANDLPNLLAADLQRYFKCLLQVFGFLVFVHTLNALEFEGEYNVLALLSNYKI
jgi:hypothetical protein